MFKFARNREVLWPVTVRVPREDGSGAVEQMEAKVLYQLLSKTELRDMTQAKIDTSELLQKKVRGWEGIIDADTAAPLPFTDENLAALLEIPFVHQAVLVGLTQASVGAERKN